MVIRATDHMRVRERREQPRLGTLRHRVAELPPSDVVTTVISEEEHRRGWRASLARARSMAQQIRAYGRLLAHLEHSRRMPVLGCDEAAAMVVQRWRRSRRRIGRWP